ncbi:MAG: M42 family metallopeptidase [Bacteroidia bacterium]
MAQLNIPLFKEISETPGAPGYENRIREVVLREVSPLADHVSVDNLGNVVALKKGTASGTENRKRVMAAAHMDEIGFIVKHIDSNGFIRFHLLGGFDPKTLTAQRVIIHGKKDVVGVMGSKPIHVMNEEERKRLPKATDYFIDCGMPREEVEQFISVGNPITRDREFIQMGHCVNGKSIDNRVAVFLLIEALRELKDIPYDFYAVFTVQEEVGIRGASVAAHTIDPDFGIGIDTTVAYDLPGASDHEMVTSLGKGAGIKVLDGSVISDSRMVEFMKHVAEKNNIAYQMEVLPAGGTDTAGVQRMGKRGAIAGAISIPTRHLHQVIEMAHTDDIRAAIDLLKECLYSMDQYDWGFPMREGEKE